MKVVAIIQARMGSSRLPGKAMADLGGAPMLARVVARTSRAATVRQVVVATTTETADQVIVDLCAARGWACFRGSQDDVLDRYYQAARQFAAEVVVRITSDCPLIDPSIIDRVVTEFLRLQPDADYVSNVGSRRSFPRGLETEVFSFAALAKAWDEAREPAFREHVTLYMYRRPDRFRIHDFVNERDCSEMRWTVDTPEDYALVCRIYEHFGHDRFSWTEVLAVLAAHPEWLELNRHVRQKIV